MLHEVAKGHRKQTEESRPKATNENCTLERSVADCPFPQRPPLALLFFVVTTSVGTVGSIATEHHQKTPTTPMLPIRREDAETESTLPRSVEEFGESAPQKVPAEAIGDADGVQRPAKRRRSKGNTEKQKRHRNEYQKKKRQYPWVVRTNKVVWVPHRDGQCEATVLETTAAKQGDLGDTVTVKRLYDGVVEQHVLGPKAQQVSVSLRRTNTGFLTRAAARAATSKEAFKVPQNLAAAPRVVPSHVVEDERKDFAARASEFEARRVRLAKPAPAVPQRFARRSILFCKAPKKKQLIIEACAGSGVLSYFIDYFAGDEGMDIATLTIDHDRRCCPDLVENILKLDIKKLCEKYDVIGIHVAIPCEAGCKSANKDYGRNVDVVAGHGSDLTAKCSYRLSNQRAVMAWVADAVEYIMPRNPAARFSIECTAYNYAFGTPEYDRFLELTGAIEVPYDHCAFGLDFVKTGLLVTNLYTLPGKDGFAAWRCPIGGCHCGTEDHPHRGLKPAELAQAAVYPEPVAKAWARGWVDHFYFAWFFPDDFSALYEKFKARRLLYGFSGSRRFTEKTIKKKRKRL